MSVSPSSKLGTGMLAVLMLLAAGCQQDTAPLPEEPHATTAPAWFVEAASETGLDFVHRTGHDGERFLMPESMSGGGALFDMDGDGFLDVYLVQSAEPPAGSGQPAGNRLYRNLAGETDVLRFEDVTESSGAGDRGYGTGVATGDYDRDGDLDLYVTNVGPNVLLRNDGGGSFTDVTDSAGVGDPGFGASAAFLDVDHDGDLDLWVVNYLVWSAEVERSCRNKLGESDYCDPTEYDAPAQDVLYRNDGAGAFTDVSRSAGLTSAFGNGLGVVAGDFDGDGRTDVFVTNDRMPDQLWTHVGDAADGGVALEDHALLAGCAMDDDGKAKAGMGVASADVDDDGDPDLMVVNFTDESDSFFRNEGSYFTDATALFGLGGTSRAFNRFGLGFADFDNDGVLDLYEATGRVARSSPRYSEDPYAEPGLLFRGTLTGDALRFEEVLPRGGTAELLAATSRAAVFGDVDNDGGIDVLVVNRDGRPHLLHNSIEARGHWILFRVLDERGSDAIGAVVRLRLGERRVTRTVRTAYSYCAANDPRVHVGLGPASGVREVEVEWLDGRRELFGDFDADRIVTLQRGRGEPA